LQGTLFVHGGIDPVDAPLGVEELNRKVRGDLQEYLQTREALIRDGWLHRLIPFGEDFSKVQLRLKAEMLVGEHTDTDEAVLRRARRFLELVSNDFSGEDAPVWSRKLALSDEVEFAPILDEILGQLGVERIVVGHTPQRTKEIGVRFGGKVFLIDTGAGPTYGGRPSALEIEGDAVRAIYPGESRLLVAPTEPSDREIERILLEGEIVEMKEIGQGITRPMKVLLELDGKQRKAAFKTVDIHKTGLTYLEGAPPEPNFTDSYLYERAAYLLDRELGLRMVPVTVLRRIGSRAGALVDWVEGAIDGEKRLQSKMEPEDPSFLERQQAAMTVFDALIYNTDRNLGNQLFTPSDWKLHLIDHTRCFRQHKTLPAKFGDRQMRLPRRMYEGLIAMEDDHLEQLLDGLLTKSRLKALLERRKLILERVERDRGRFGDEITFYEDSESDVPAANP
jgi:hypothetical protein